MFSDVFIIAEVLVVVDIYLLDTEGTERTMGLISLRCTLEIDFVCVINVAIVLVGVGTYMWHVLNRGCPIIVV